MIIILTNTIIKKEIQYIIIHYLKNILRNYRLKSQFNNIKYVLNKFLYIDCFYKNTKNYFNK